MSLPHGAKQPVSLTATTGPRCLSSASVLPSDRAACSPTSLTPGATPPRPSAELLGSSLTTPTMASPSSGCSAFTVFSSSFRFSPLVQFKFAVILHGFSSTNLSNSNLNPIFSMLTNIQINLLNHLLTLLLMESKQFYNHLSNPHSPSPRVSTISLKQILSAFSPSPEQKVSTTSLVRRASTFSPSPEQKVSTTSQRETDY